MPYQRVGLDASKPHPYQVTAAFPAPLSQRTFQNHQIMSELVRRQIFVLPHSSAGQEYNTINDDPLLGLPARAQNLYHL